MATSSWQSMHSWDCAALSKTLWQVVQSDSISAWPLMTWPGINRVSASCANASSCTIAKTRFMMLPIRIAFQAFIGASRVR